MYFSKDLTFSRASGSWWITTTSFRGYWGEGGKKKKNQKLLSFQLKIKNFRSYYLSLEVFYCWTLFAIPNVTIQFSQAYPKVTKVLHIPKVLVRDVKSSNLYWNGFSVSDYSSKLNNRLQTRNGTFNFFVDEILPRLKRKHDIASFSLYLFEQIENILPLLWNFPQETPLCPVWGNLKKEQTAFSSVFMEKKMRK